MVRIPSIQLLLFLFIFNALYTPNSRPIAIALAPATVACITTAAVLVIAQAYHNAFGPYKSLALANLRTELQECGITQAFEIDPLTLKAEIPWLMPPSEPQNGASLEYPEPIPEIKKFFDSISITHGAKLKNSPSGMYVSAALGQQNTHAKHTQAIAEDFLNNALETAAHLQTNPTHLENFLMRFNHTVAVLCKTNSDDLIERIMARLELPHLTLEGLYGLHLEKAKSILFRTFFTKNGRLYSYNQHKESYKAIKEFIGATCNNPEKVLANIPINQAQTNESCSDILKRWGRIFFDIQSSIAGNKENQLISAYITHYQQFKFETAHGIKQKTRHKKLFEQIENYFKQKYQCSTLKELFEESNDPLFDYIHPVEQHHITANLAKLEQWATLLYSRKEIIDSIANSWQLPPTHLYQQTLYHLLDHQAFKTPLHLIQTIITYIACQELHHCNQLISAFFLPNGAFKDFAQYDISYAQEYICHTSPTSADLDQLYILNLFLIMGNCSDSETVCQTYTCINDWAQSEPLNMCCIPVKKIKNKVVCFSEHTKAIEFKQDGAGKQDNKKEFVPIVAAGGCPPPDPEDPEDNKKKSNKEPHPDSDDEKFRKAVKFATTESKLAHFFKNNLHDHGFNKILDKMGGRGKDVQIKLVKEIIKELMKTSKLPKENSFSEIPIKILGEIIHVRVFMGEDIIKIATIFAPQ